MKIFATHRPLFVLILLFYFGNLLSQSSSQNFIHSIAPLIPVSSSNLVDALPPNSRIDDINYLDGLNRTIQEVLPMCSPGSKDIISVFDFDNSGLAKKQYLPFTNAIPANLNIPTGIPVYGSYRATGLAQQSNFYATPPGKVKSNSTAFSEVKYDNSPLDLVKEFSIPASSWNMSSSKTIKSDYDLNSANSIIQWAPVSGGAVSGNGVTPYYYPSKKLIKNISTNPDGGKTESYFDQDGKIIVTIESVSSGPIKNNYTYYVYNSFNEITCIIPPAAYDYMIQNAYYQTALVIDYLFLYDYDHRGRVVKAKKPSRGYDYFVYNDLNQIIFSQNEVSKANNQWFFTKYDVLGREIINGIYNSNVSQTSLQSAVNNATSPFFERRTSVNFNNNFGYTSNALPLNNYDIHVVKYYDDYDFNNDGNADVSANTSPYSSINMSCNTEECSETSYANYANIRSNTLGYLTGSRVKVLESSATVPWLISSNFYDNQGQIIQVKSNNYANGYDIVKLNYDFSGKVIHSQTRHTAYSDPEISITERFYYDKMGRVQKTVQKINNQNPVIINKLKYNETGQVIEKNIGSMNCVDYLQSIDYTYNQQGWLTHMNNADLNANGSDNNDDNNDLFGFELKYENPSSGISGIVGKYSGIISEVHWKSYSDNVKKSYATNYDLINRMQNAFYSEYNGAWNHNGKYDEYNVNYDANGNITTLKRNGWRNNSTYGLMDNLNYNYYYSSSQNTNQLYNISESSTVQGYNDVKPMSGSYHYDLNGNMIYDPGKNLNITYNHLDLPYQASNNNGSVSFIYDALGNLLKRTVVTNPPGIGPPSFVDNTYINGFNYQNSGLESFSHSEGRVVPDLNSAGSFLYEYSLTDHLGNVRINFSDVNHNNIIDLNNSEVLQENHYYPYGLDMYGLNKLQVGPENNKKFNDADFYDELAINLYNFGPRTYDPTLGRWNNVDPAADVAPNWSPYRFGFNNPLNVSDPSGLMEDYAISEFYDFSGAGTGGPGDPPLTKAQVDAAVADNNKNCGCNGWTNVNGVATFNASSNGNSSTSIKSSNGGGGGKSGGGGGSGGGGSSTVGSFASGLYSSGVNAVKGTVNAAVGLATGETWAAIGQVLKNVAQVYVNAMGRDMETADWSILEKDVNSVKTFVNTANAEDWGRATGNVALTLLPLKINKLEAVSKVAAKGGDKVKYIGRLEDLKGIPRSQTLLDDLPNLGNPKANYYQNMSVLRKALRDGYTIKDASWFRPNSELAPTLLNPNRTVGQTFLGAERLLLKNRGLWP